MPLWGTVPPLHEHPLPAVVQLCPGEEDMDVLSLDAQPEGAVAIEGKWKRVVRFLGVEKWDVRHHGFAGGDFNHHVSEFDPIGYDCRCLEVAAGDYRPAMNVFLCASHRTAMPSRNFAMDSPAGSLPATAASMISGVRRVRLRSLAT